MRRSFSVFRRRLVQFDVWRRVRGPGDLGKTNLLIYLNVVEVGHTGVELLNLLDDLAVVVAQTQFVLRVSPGRTTTFTVLGLTSVAVCVSTIRWTGRRSVYWRGIHGRIRSDENRAPLTHS